MMANLALSCGGGAVSILVPLCPVSGRLRDNLSLVSLISVCFTRNVALFSSYWLMHRGEDG